MIRAMYSQTAAKTGVQYSRIILAFHFHDVHEIKAEIGECAPRNQLEGVFIERTKRIAIRLGGNAVA